MSQLTQPSADQVHAFLRSRRSSRRFTDLGVDSALIDRIIETATWSPNAHNRQSWRFVLLESRFSRQSLADALEKEFLSALLNEGLSEADARKREAISRARILEAPVAILICLETSELDEYKDHNRSQGEHIMGIQSAAMAGSQILVAAHAEGLGGVWMCAPLFSPKEVNSALQLLPSWQAQGLILLGQVEDRPKHKARRPLSEVYEKR